MIKRDVKVLLALVTICICLFAGTLNVFARANACANCDRGTYNLYKTEYVWKETGVEGTCDDCGSTRRKLRKYAIKYYKCNNCSSQYHSTVAMSNYMWACECDE